MADMSFGFIDPETGDFIEVDRAKYDANVIRKAMPAHTVGTGPAEVHLKTTPRVVHTLRLAEDEARRMGHSYVGTEHLLLAMVREGEGIAAGVLESLGVNLDKVRTAVEFILGAPGKKKK